MHISVHTCASIYIHPLQFTKKGKLYQCRYCKNNRKLHFAYQYNCYTFELQLELELRYLYKLNESNCNLNSTSVNK